MIGLGTWVGRDENLCPYVHYNDASEVIRDTVAGVCKSHGPEYEFEITSHAPHPPIIRGCTNLLAAHSGRTVLGHARPI